jgi:hypothetical protein
VQCTQLNPRRSGTADHHRPGPVLPVGGGSQALPERSHLGSLDYYVCASGTRPHLDTSSGSQ